MRYQLAVPHKANQHPGASLFSTLTGTCCPLGRCLSFSGEQTMNQLDQIDQSYLDIAAQLRSNFQHPDMGDYVLFPTGELLQP